MFDTVSEITTAVEEKEGEISALREQMESDFDLFALTEYQPTDKAGKARKGYQAYTSSAPRNIFDKVTDAINRAVVTIQIKLPEDAKKAEREAASVGELYLFGALGAIDRRLAKRGEPPLREGLAFIMDLRGWFSLRVLVYVPRGETETVFDVVPWDPLHTTWEQGSRGLLWANNKRKASKAQILSEYGFTINGKDAEILDFWDEERNSIIIDGTFAKEPTKHKIGHVPVLVGSIGSMPTIQTKSFGTTIQYQGDSVWSAARGLYEPMNKYISTLMDVQQRGVTGSLYLKSKDGTKTIEGDPYADFRVTPLGLEDEIGYLPLPPAPPETAAILGLIEKDVQQSTLPYPLAYGGTEAAQSGIALSIQMDNTRSVYSPRTSGLARVYTWLCEELLGQFATKGMKPAELRGYRPNGSFFQTKIKPTEINKQWVIAVTVEPRLPRDAQAEIMQAQAITQKRGPYDIPLASLQYAREEILHMRDPDAEEDRALVEMGKGILPIIATRIAAATKKAGDAEGADLITAWFASQGQGKSLQGPSAPQGPSGLPGQPVGMQGGGAPSGAPPIPPDLAKAILQVLMDSGKQDVAQALVAVLEGRAPLVPELIEAIIQVLVTSGQPQLAEALLKALGVAPPGGPGPGGPEAGGPPVGMPPQGM